MDAGDLAFAGLARQAALVRAGEVSSRELVELCLRRIQALDPRLNAFRAVYAERALADAAQADARRGSGPLHGVPVAIKDDCDVAGDVTAFGSNAFDGAARADAEVVRRLRAAGAVILGKTHVPELTIMPATESPTWGATRNPWDPQRTPGGSSGGSGAAVAAGLVGAALGSDGAGSIRIPAGCCGLFGLKPQHDRIPFGARPTAWLGMTVYGPITRTVADAALFLDAVTGGVHGYGAAAARAPARLRVAVSDKVPPPVVASPDAEQRGAVSRIAERLRALGHDVEDRDPDYGRTAGAFIPRYLRGIHEDARAVAHPERLSRRARGYARLGGLFPEPVVRRAVAGAAADRERLARSLDGCDVLLTPMFTRRPVAVGAWEGRSALWTFNGTARWVPYCGAFNHTGQPAASVPAGLTPDGFPLAAQLVGRSDGEATLLALAAQLEADLDWPAWRPAVA